MTDLYPEPPHLSVFVVPEVGRAAALAAAWDLLTAAGCVPTGDVLVARRAEAFRAVSDVARDAIRPDGPLRDLVADPRTLRATLHHPLVGTVTLGPASTAELDEPHPVEVAVHAGPLSVPPELWDESERRAAKGIVDAMESLLLSLAGATGARYGGLGVEAVFPTPAALHAAVRPLLLWPTTWFWSPPRSASTAADERELLSSLDDDAVRRHPAGVLVRVWRPWHDPSSDEDLLGRVTDFLRRAVVPPGQDDRPSAAGLPERGSLWLQECPNQDQGLIRPLLSAEGTVVLVCDSGDCVWLQPADVARGRSRDLDVSDWSVAPGVHLTPGSTRWATWDDLPDAWRPIFIRGIDE